METVAGREPVASSAGGERSIRILVVDDHPLLRDGVHLRLSQVARFQVMGEASSGPEALEFLERTPVDIVLTDLRMSEMDGCELAAAITQRFDSIAVIVFTLYGDEVDVRRAVESGARGYVLKTEPAASLIAAVDSVLQGAIYLSPPVAHFLFRQQPANRLALTEREIEVVKLLGRGLSTKEIARAMNIEMRTVQTHRGNVRRKLHLDGQTALMKYAIDMARSKS